MALTATGLYGLLSFWVGQRRRELGLRLALGAQAGQILGLVLRRGLWVTVIGAALGLMVVPLLTTVLAAAFQGVRPPGIGLQLMISAILLAVALAACSIPAARAARTAPVEALREE